MTTDSFTTTMTADVRPEDAYRAVLQPQTWWSTSIQGSAAEVGDEFVFDSPGHHLWRFRVTRLEEPHGITWLVLDDSSTEFVADPAEWNGTEVQFDIAARGDRTEVRFTHSGLVPQFECFEACSIGWTGYIQRSLHRLLTTGSGEPGRY